MTLSRLVPMLEVEDLKQTLDYYQVVLGFSVMGHMPNYWAQVARDGVAIMFSARYSEKRHPQPVMTGSLYFHTKEVEVWWAMLKEKAKVVYPLEDFENGMREFAIRDINGYMLQFGWELPPEEARKPTAE
jgi:uncharacterized glyoxalase superfamily protein PhnB